MKEAARGKWNKVSNTKISKDKVNGVGKLFKQLFIVVLVAVMTLSITVTAEASSNANIRSGSQVAGQQFAEAIQIIMTRYIGSQVTVNQLAGAALRGMTGVTDVSISTNPYRSSAARGEAQVAGQQLAYAVELIMTHHSGSRITINALLEAGLRGMTDVLDQYSIYLSPAEISRFYNAMDGRLFGIGVEMLAQEDGRVVVGRVLPNSPASDAGVHAGDVLVYVDREHVVGMTLDAVIARIANPANPRVHIVVERGGRSHSFNIVKADIHSPTVIVERFERIPEAQGFGDLSGFRYMNITSIGLVTSADVERALNQMQREGVRGIVLDLRGNSGGYLNVTIDIARQLVPQGAILHSVDGSGRIRTHSSFLREMPFDNVVVLIDSHTASGAEVLASALQDTGTTVIGETSFGKGMVQGVYGLRNGGALMLTVEEYFRRTGGRIDGIGVIPNIQESGPQTPGGHDPALRRAVEMLLVGVR